MNLSLYKEEVFQKYKNPAQQIRVMSERWFSHQMYCPACASDKILQFPDNKPVADFYCPGCGEIYQLKSQKRPFTAKVVDGAYGSMMQSVNANRIPNFFFLHYTREAFTVADLLLVPRFFFSESVIEKRNPLPLTARRAGWVGCNILFKNLAEDGKIKVIERHRELPMAQVRKAWEKVAFLKDSRLEGKGWINDIIWCINKLGKKEFSLKEMYAFAGHLKELHPDNNHIEDKIRQQLQFLRNKDFLIFLGPGRYKLIS